MLFRLSLLFNVMLLVSNTYIHKEVYIYKVADHLYKEVRQAYFRGCLEGAEYPPEWRKSKTEFNQNSTMMYCHRAKTNKEDYFLDEAQKVIDKNID